MTTPEIISNTKDTGTVVHIKGRLVTSTLHLVEKQMAGYGAQENVTAIDLSDLEAIDTAGAWMVVSLQKALASSGQTPEILSPNADRSRLIEKVADAAFTKHAAESPRKTLRDVATDVGRSTVSGFKSAESLVGFLGLVIVRFVGTLFAPRRLRATALFAQMQETGYNALPIIALMGFLIGIVLAFQGAAQLRQFGAEVFVVDLIAVSVLRELGILLTAIIVAGRSGSAYTAVIGSMKVNEEIDAMNTLGLDPIEVLVIPRLLALMLMLPVLGLVANVSALVGGTLMSWMELGVSPNMFMTRFRENTDVWHLIVGMIKAPFFAVIISVVACWQGFQVGGSADSVGQKTRTSVVQGIFLVIVLDALFSIFFAEIGV